MGAERDFLGRLGPELDLLLPVLDEKARRLVLGAVARAAGDGGVTAVAKLSGASWQTALLKQRRMRRAGGQVKPSPAPCVIRPRTACGRSTILA